MTAKEYVENFAEQNGFWNEDKLCEAYIIALGVNDIIGRGMDIGSIKRAKACKTNRLFNDKSRYQ